MKKEEPFTEPPPKFQRLGKKRTGVKEALKDAEGETFGVKFKIKKSGGGIG